MRKIFQFLLSMRFTGILLLTFGITIASATFVENDFGTVSARAVIYNAIWFELLLLLIMINLTGSIIQNKLYKKGKLTIFVFHLAFIIIILGAAITRFVGFEGLMYIREGNSSDQVLTESNYIRLNAVSGEEKVFRYKKVLFSPLVRNSYNEKFSINGQTVTVSMKQYFSNAEEVIDKDTGGIALMQLIVPENNQRISYIFRDRETKEIQGISFTFNDTTKNGVNIFFREGKLVIKSPFEFSELNMSDQSEISFGKDSIYPFDPMKIFIFNKVSCVLGSFIEKGIVKPIPIPDAGKDEGMEALVMEITSNNQVKETTIWNKRNQTGDYQTINFNGMELSLYYGPMPMRIPFLLKLIDFKVEHYPGSDSPSSFESKVVLMDNTKGLMDTARIYMNNILKYKGYRFYQSSYDSDERGTILSVNRDFPGTMITYLGYILMVSGMVLSIFNPSSRFRKLNEQVKKIQLDRGLISTPVIAILLMSFSSYKSYGQDTLRINPKAIIPVSQAKSFGKIWVQDEAGRIKPLNTVSSEILRKVVRTNNFHGLNSDQVFLSMIIYPEYWKTIPMIRISNAQLRDTLKINSKYASYEDLKAFKGYTLKPFVDNVYRKKPSERSKFDNEVLRVDERFNIIDLAFSGRIANVFPSKLMVTDNVFNEVPKETEFVSILMSQYIQGILDGLETGNYSNADKSLNTLWNYQIQNGQHIVPSFKRTNLEIIYNKAEIFERLSIFYGFIGFILLVLTFTTIFLPGIKLEKFVMVSTWLIIAGFLIHTAGLGIRWYIAAHAPWSNGYESLLYISWATTLAGIAFVRRSRITLAVTAILSFLILYVAHLSWMDPEITNLVPVLKSYWLVIHVAIITASYGFFAIAALLAVINLILMIIKRKQNAGKIELEINEITCTVEMAMIIGLYMVATGTILGGVWANESWGRYWGWDPKETWALVTIIVYAFIAHIRLIPGLKGIYTFNLMAVIGFGSIIMTYFGVNYYLSGLHSYAKGDPLPVPPFVYYMLGFIFTLGLLAYYRHRKIQHLTDSVGG